MSTNWCTMSTLYYQLLEEDLDLEDHIYECLISILIETLIQEERQCRRVVHDVGFTGTQVVRNMVSSHFRVCFDSCRLTPTLFIKLCNNFKESSSLRNTRYVSVEEQVSIFLNIMAHGLKNRVVQFCLQHSGETISRHFNNVLDVVCNWTPQVIRPKESLSNTPRFIEDHHEGKFFPHFKDCVGALDGTHVKAIIRKDDQVAYMCGRDPKYCSQNILGVCDFNMRFTFLSASWEGFAHDNRVLNHALSNPSFNFPIPPPDKYYLVDSGYPNREHFLAPYRNTRYHRSSFNDGQPRGKKELFNKMHASLRNIIERAFGVLKQRWGILQNMPPFTFDKQVKIVITAAALHNFIIDENVDDEFLNGDTMEASSSEATSEGEGTAEALGMDDVQMGVVRDVICNHLAISRRMP